MQLASFSEEHRRPHCLPLYRIPSLPLCLAVALSPHYLHYLHYLQSPSFSHRHRLAAPRTTPGGPGHSCPKTSTFINTHPPLFPTSPAHLLTCLPRAHCRSSASSDAHLARQILLAQHLSSVGTPSDPSRTRNCRPLPLFPCHQVTSVRAPSTLRCPFSSPSAG